MAAAAKPSRRSGRTTVIPLTSAASGARIIDLIPLPLPLFVIFRLTLLAFRHWVVIGTLLCCLWLYSVGFAWQAGILTILLAPTVAFAYIAILNRHHSPRAWVRAVPHLWALKRRWPAVRHAAGLEDGPRPPHIQWLRRPPRIADDSGNSLRVVVDTSRVNATAESVEQKRNAIADNVPCKRARVRKTKPGQAEITFEWHNNAATVRSISHSSLPPLALDEDNSVRLDLDTSLLVVGESGSGKSTLTWSFLNELVKNEVPHNITAIDPKRVELSELQNGEHTTKYAITPQEIKDAIQDFRKQMEYTLEDMKSRGIRKVEISQTYPLHLLIVDELLLVGEEFKNDPAQSDLGKILILGRAAGFVVIGNSQLSQGDALGRVRDLFPQRICMAVKSGHITNAVLGPRAEERGALCSEITEPGTGYVYTDQSGTFQRFHAPDVPDAGVRRIAQGLPYVPRSTVSGSALDRVRQGGYVYVLWPAPSLNHHGDGTTVDQRPLYIGQAKNPEKRFRQHAAEKEWWNQVDHSRTQISERYSTKQDLDEAEKEKIQSMRPIFNLVHRDYSDV